MTEVRSEFGEENFLKAVEKAKRIYSERRYYAGSFISKT